MLSDCYKSTNLHYSSTSALFFYLFGTFCFYGFLSFPHPPGRTCFAISHTSSTHLSLVHSFQTVSSISNTRSYYTHHELGSLFLFGEKRYQTGKYPHHTDNINNSFCLRRGCGWYGFFKTKYSIMSSIDRSYLSFFMPSLRYPRAWPSMYVCYVLVRSSSMCVNADLRSTSLSTSQPQPSYHIISGSGSTHPSYSALVKPVVWL